MIDEDDELRQTGQSTRIVDECIQKFFTEGGCKVKDHYNNKIADLYTFRKVIKRLAIEHPNVSYEANVGSKTIEFKGYHHSDNEMEEPSNILDLLEEQPEIEWKK